MPSRKIFMKYFRIMVAFVIAPIGAPLSLVLLGGMAGYPSIANGLRESVILSYLAALTLGGPAWLLSARLLWSRPRHFAALGSLIGATTYFVVWQALPPLAAYHNGRLDMYGALKEVV
jgi:hypothetical protein